MTRRVILAIAVSALAWVVVILSAAGAGAAPVVGPCAPGAACPASDYSISVPGLPSIPGPGDVVGGLTRSGTEAALSAMSSWVVDGSVSILQDLSKTLHSVTSPSVDGTWFSDHYWKMAGIAGVLIVPLLLVAAITSVLRQDAAVLLRAVVVHLPLAGLGTVVAVNLVGLLLAATDQMSAAVGGGPDSDLYGIVAGLGNQARAAGKGGTSATFAIMAVALVMVVGAFMVFIELAVRDAAVYVALLFLPLALAGLVWPATMRWTRRLAELLAALILSKFVIVAVLSLAASALAAGLGGAGLGVLVSGAGMLLLAAFAPYALLRLAPVVEAGAIAHLEGVGRRVVPGELSSAGRQRMVDTVLPREPDPGNALAPVAERGAGSLVPGASPEGIHAGPEDFFTRSAAFGSATAGVGAAAAGVGVLAHTATEAIDEVGRE